jgi:hypothetical protein
MALISLLIRVSSASRLSGTEILIDTPEKGILDDYHPGGWDCWAPVASCHP